MHFGWQPGPSVIYFLSMRPLIVEIETSRPPESLVGQRLHLPGGRPQSSAVLLRRSGETSRYSFLAANPFLIFRSFGSRCEITECETHVSHVQFGNPWQVLDALMSRFELLDEVGFPFPLGGCFGFWGYDLKNFTEPKLPRRALNDLELPDCHVGFYDSVVVFDHQLSKTFIVSTGLDADGSRTETRAHEKCDAWKNEIQNPESARHDTN